MTDSGSNMNHFFNRSFRSLAFALSVVACLAWASSFDEGGPPSVGVQHFDKIVHFFVFGLLATLWFRFLPGSLLGTGRFIGAIVLTLLYGVVDEWIQFYKPLRSFDAWDWLADGIGSLTAVWVYRSWRLYRRALETPIFDLFRFRLAEVD